MAASAESLTQSRRTTKAGCTMIDELNSIESKKPRTQAEVQVCLSQLCSAIVIYPRKRLGAVKMAVAIVQYNKQKYTVRPMGTCSSFHRSQPRPSC